MKTTTRNTLIAKNGKSVYPYSSFEEFCQATGLDRSKFRKVPTELFVEGHGHFKLYRMPLNLNMNCNQLISALKGKLTIITQEAPGGLKQHEFITPGGMYTVVVDERRKKIVTCHVFDKEIELDEYTHNFVLDRLTNY